MLVRHCDICNKELKDDSVRFDVTIDKFNLNGSKSFGSNPSPYPKRFDLCESCCQKVLSMFRSDK